MTIKRLIILLLLLVLSTSVQAQRFNQKKINDGIRYGNWEGSLLLQYQTSTDVSSPEGQSLDIDSSVGFGFGFAWNWTDRVHLSYRFSLNKPNYSATIVPEIGEPQTINYKMARYSNQFNLTYHFLRGPLTPFVQAGVGWTKLDSNVPSQPPTTGCWWDPWWGYICTTTWETFKTSEFTYNVGVGVRWDVNGAIFVRGYWNRQFINLTNGNLDIDTLTLESGIMW